MDTGSVEGLLITLLFIVPGGLGMQFRRYIYPSARPTAFAELSHALATSASALVVLEAGNGLIGFLEDGTFAMGDYLVNDLVGGRRVLIGAGPTIWVRYLGLAAVAVVLPPILGRLRNTQRLRKLFGGIARYDKGFDQLFEVNWSGGKRDASPWVTVQLNDGQRLQGQVVWRSTAPNDPELTLTKVWDVTAPRQEIPIGEGFVWLPPSTIHRVWLSTPDAPPAE